MSDNFELSPAVVGSVRPAGLLNLDRPGQKVFGPKHNWIQQKSKKWIQPPEKRKKNRTFWQKFQVWQTIWLSLHNLYNTTMNFRLNFKKPCSILLFKISHAELFLTGSKNKFLYSVNFLGCALFSERSFKYKTGRVEGGCERNSMSDILLPDMRDLKICLVKIIQDWSKELKKLCSVSQIYTGFRFYNFFWGFKNVLHTMWLGH